MNRIAVWLAVLLASSGFAMSAHAQEAPGTISLSPEDRAAILDAAARRPETELPINGLDHQICGEMGFEIGTRGQRALFGSTILPLGENGTAAFSFMTQQGHWRR